MIKQELDNIINNYQYDMDFFNSIDEYLQHYNVTILSDIKYCNFRIKVLINKLEYEEKSKELKKTFNNCIAFKAVNKKNSNKYIIFHPCTYENFKYQLSYFDEYGAIMDEKSETIEDTMHNYYNRCRDYNIIEMIA